MSNNVSVLNVDELRIAVQSELAFRHCGSMRRFSYAEQRGGKETLYGLTGAVYCMSTLGISYGNRRLRQNAADRLLSYQGRDGKFRGGYSPAHAAHMVIGSLNLLGQPVPPHIAPLAPTDPAVLAGWLELHDWSSTHKDLCAQVIPLLASGLVGVEWVNIFTNAIAGRLDPSRPLGTWCEADAPRFRVISCIYHVLSAFDAGLLPYPEPEWLIRRLLDLRWDLVDETVERTVCTDGDWAILLLRLCEILPDYYVQVHEAILRVSARRVREWHYNRSRVLELNTHHLFCYLWGTAVFQAVVRDHYTGGVVIDPLNDPSLYRLRMRLD